MSPLHLLEGYRRNCGKERKWDVLLDLQDKRIQPLALVAVLDIQIRRDRAFPRFFLPPLSYYCVPLSKVPHQMGLAWRWSRSLCVLSMI